MTDTEAHAYLITGARSDQFRGPAIGVAFYPDPPDRKVLTRMGFTTVHTTERIRVDGDAVKDGGAPVPKEPTLFFFQRGPHQTSTYVAKLHPDGSHDSVKEEPLAPGHIIPRLMGVQAKRFIPEPTGPRFSDGKHLTTRTDGVDHSKDTKLPPRR